MSNIYQFSVENNKQESIELTQFTDKVLLIVNTASNCGFTPQYQGLQALHDSFQEKGFEVLAFPCNQFKQQESAKFRSEYSRHIVKIRTGMPPKFCKNYFCVISVSNNKL